MRSLLAAILLSLTAACGDAPLPPPAQLGKLVIVTRQALGIYHVDGDGRTTGFVHDLALRFAGELGVEARFVVAHDSAEAARILAGGRAHFAAGGLAPDEHPALRFTRPAGELKPAPAPLDTVLSGDADGETEGRAIVASGWAFPDSGGALLEKAEAFLERMRREGTLERLVDRYFGHVHRLSADDIERFLEKMHNVLPRYRRHFVDAQEIHGLDWRLLAALAYQESQWDPLATSYTNVRGMMMLTEDTADRLRVADRLDPRQSILAGARYLAELKEQLPPEVAEPDRTWLAMAAYNLGMGHLNGARFIAPLVKRDPASWFEMKQVLPLLAKPEYYSRLKSGAARGGEAVIMTENIRNYYDLLRRFEQPAVNPQAFSMRSMPAM